MPSEVKILPQLNFPNHPKIPKSSDFTPYKLWYFHAYFKRKTLNTLGKFSLGRIFTSEGIFGLFCKISTPESVIWAANLSYLKVFYERTSWEAKRESYTHTWSLYLKAIHEWMFLFPQSLFNSQNFVRGHSLSTY